VAHASSTRGRCLLDELASARPPIAPNRVHFTGDLSGSSLRAHESILDAPREYLALRGIIAVAGTIRGWSLEALCCLRHGSRHGQLQRNHNDRDGPLGGKPSPLAQTFVAHKPWQSTL
jgi:hypothetical protein